jgi:hypothetical protein
VTDNGKACGQSDSLRIVVLSGRRSLPKRTRSSKGRNESDFIPYRMSHCASAREMAETYFRSGGVLTRLLTAVHRKPPAKNA